MSTLDEQVDPRGDLRGDPPPGATSRGGERGLSINRVLLTGRCIENPDIRYTPSGSAVATFRIVADAPTQPPSGARRSPAALVDVVCWNELAHSAGKSVSTGAFIDIEGVLQARTVEDRAGGRRQILEIHARRFEILDLGCSDEAVSGSETTGRSIRTSRASSSDLK
ncbi:MAG: single-stranded DNA-binding protein [Candidatus Eisenbacteria bacterium]|uniref:Single-stranded DNA-binding protein n=1 Tax=Eiseniibacteriota bacterium TaxID=2212470 RepID=A0A948RTC7_UNCEI|nr:single-stranded DNA-binding protein [Candidatus Eisenbacteria bacterium]MBU1950660.1 single-stranded DNA-binding protein [Candidatus Eisenbacteria bacterium]MBU2689641.1 single-stranded DNA-binding protein [Candidatus Eisenbacteria bacterium]